jgi:hypothetical protein
MRFDSPIICECVHNDSNYQGCSTSTVCVVVDRYPSRTRRCSHQDRRELVGRQYQVWKCISVDGIAHTLVELVIDEREKWLALMIEGRFVNLTATLYRELVGGECDSSGDK